MTGEELPCTQTEFSHATTFEVAGSWQRPGACDSNASCVYELLHSEKFTNNTRTPRARASGGIEPKDLLAFKKKR